LHSITATYAGDGNYLGASSSALAQTVEAAATTPGVLAIAAQSAKVTTRGALNVKVTCRDAACTGKLKLTARVTKTTGKGTHRRRKTTTVTIGTASLSALTVKAHSVSVRLTKTGLRMLTNNRYKLNTTATVTYESGSTTKTTRAAVKLTGTKPKPKKK
jgi:hypothetical protein